MPASCSTARSSSWDWPAGGTIPPLPDELELVDCMISNAVRCVPPQNKPKPDEIARCRQFLVGRIAALPNLVTLLALGRIAHEAILDALNLKKRDFPFAHGARHVAAGRAYPVRQLSLLAPEHQYRAAHHRHVRDGGWRGRGKFAQAVTGQRAALSPPCNSGML